MNPKELRAKTPSPRTGLFATLRARLHAGGTTAPKVSRCAGLPLALLLVLSALALTAAPALASPPEPPELSVESITTTEATVLGILNPTAGGEMGTYEFLYQPSHAKECEGGGGESARTPPGVSFGLLHEELPAEVLSGLQPNTEYAVCLRVQSTATKEAAVSLPVTFTTLPAPPAVGGESALVGSTAATLEAQVNPNNQETTFSFQYATNEALTGATTVAGEAPLNGFGAQSASVSTGALLTPGTTYFYRVIAENEQSKVEGKPVEGDVRHFTTVPAPSTDEVKPFAQTTATFNGHFTLDSLDTRYFFRYNTGAECAGGAATPEAHAGTGAGEVPQAAQVTGLLPGTEYTVCFVTADDFGSQQGPPVTFTTLAGPLLQGLTARNITESTAELDATLNPQGLAVSSCTFEYGTSTAYGHPVSCAQTPAQIGAGNAPVAVNVTISGLEANKTYHWRLAAHDLNGTVSSPDHTFVDSIASHGEPCPSEQARSERGSSSLPDCRAYEMVTPPQKNGALIGESAFSAGAAYPVIAREGQRVIAPSIQCFDAPQSCVGLRSSEGSPFQFTRTGAGWVTDPLTPPAGFETSTWLSLSADAPSVLFIIPSAPQSEVDDFYARNEEGSLLAIGPFGELKGNADVHNLEQDGLLSTADLSHVVYETKQPAWSFDHGQHKGVYEYAPAVHAAPLMVGVSGPIASHKLISTCNTYFGGPLGTYGRLSEDGRTVYFTAEGRKDSVPCEAVSPSEAPEASQLWARIDGEEEGKARSVLISAPTPETCESAECKENTGKAKETERARDAEFEGASTDGSHVFFTDTQQLTDGASQSSGNASLRCNTIGGPGDPGCNLYESECEHCQELTKEQEPARRHLIDVSEGAREHGGPRVQGVVAMSADGSHVYFVAKGVLTAAVNAREEGAQEEADNLYVYERDKAFPKGHLAFVATLSPSDEEEWEISGLRADVTPDGRFLVFTSRRPLTADATREAGPAQVFEYDSQTRALIRVSIGEGAFNDNGNAGTGNASVVPGARGIGASSAPVRPDPTMSDDGAFVFFQSPVALTPQALNDVPAGEEKLAQNVYEYHQGHVSLISDGKDTTPEGQLGQYDPVELLGSDASGSNVFFTTLDRLLPEDTDTQRDIYDAHLCSEKEPCSPPKPAPPAPCEGEACHGTPPGAPVGQAPGSESFTGPGNLSPSVPAAAKPKTAAQIRFEKLVKALKACRKKHNKHKRAVCEKQARKKYGAAKKAKKASRATNRRRAK